MLFKVVWGCLGLFQIAWGCKVCLILFEAVGTPVARGRHEPQAQTESQVNKSSIHFPPQLLRFISTKNLGSRLDETNSGGQVGETFLQLVS